MDSPGTESVVKAGFWYCNQSLQSLSNSWAPKYFTHLLCAFADISSSTYQVTIPDDYKNTFESFTQAAGESNKDIKTLMSIGGVDSDPSTFSSMVSTKENRTAFIKTSIKKARDYKFDGLDLFWSWKSDTITGPTPRDMENLGYLLREWKEDIVRESHDDKGKQLLLSATVFHTPTIISGPDQGQSATYPADAITTYLDWINVRAYDFCNPISSPTITGPPAALHNPTPHDSHPLKTVDTCISDWINAVPANKVVLGLSFVGFEWSLMNLMNPDERGIFAQAEGSPEHRKGDGHISYRDIQGFITASHFKPDFDKDFVTDYCFAGRNWIGYDGTETIQKKIQYAKSTQLRGYFGWHVCADDLHCTLSQTASKEWDHQDAGPKSWCAIM